jgi:ferredoxin-NADP reductase
VSAPTLTVRVARKWQEARDICGFEFVADDGSPLPRFDAGAHIDVHLPGGLVRQYSLCNDPRHGNRYRIAVLRDADGRGGSRAIHDEVRQGDTLRIGMPRNQFPLARDASHHLLLAGGIGVTPMLSMAEQLSAAGESFDLHYCARSLERMAFVEQINTAAFRDRTRLHVDDGDAAQRFDLPAALDAAPAGTHLYVCGPRGFMDAVLDAARARGWPDRAAALRVLRRRGRRVGCGARVPGPAREQRQGGRRAGGLHGRRRARGPRHRRADLVRAGRMRHLRDARARRRARPSRFVSDGSGTGRRRPVHAVLFACPQRPARARPVDAARGRPSAAVHDAADDRRVTHTSVTSRAAAATASTCAVPHLQLKTILITYIMRILPR